MVIVLIRAVILYALVIFSVRLMGKRQIGELQPTELVITILISNTATLPIEDISLPMSMGIVPVLTLVCLDVIVSALTLRFRRLRRVFSGSPKIIIENGRLKPELVRELRFSNDDLLECLRAEGIFDLSEVELAIVETTGKISVCPKSSTRPPNASELGLDVKDELPPVLVVDCGMVLNKALKYLGFDENWLKSKLEKENTRIEEVYLMTADRSGKCYIVKYNGG